MDKLAWVAGTEASTLLLEKCQDTLVEFIANPKGRMGPWPAPKELHLSKLETLSLAGNVVLGADDFAKLIRRAKSLDFIHMCNIFVDGGYHTWRVVMDAIRDHENYLGISFDQIVANEAAEISLNMNTSEGVGDFELGDPWEDIEDSLINYLAGTGT
jgi:hypothetical protein